MTTLYQSNDFEIVFQVGFVGEESDGHSMRGHVSEHQQEGVPVHGGPAVRAL